MDLLANIADFVDSKTSSYAAIKINAFPGDSTEEIIISAEPSEAVVNRFLDGSEEGEQAFSFRTRSTSQQTARDQLEVYRNVLDLAELTEIAGAVSIKCEPTASPVLVSKSESGVYEYSASFRLEYFRV